MQIICKEGQIDLVATKLNLPKSAVDSIIVNYTRYLQEKICRGDTVKVLNICYIKNPDGSNDVRETLGYIATEIANMTDMGRVTVLRVLTTLEEVIIRDLRKSDSSLGYSLRGLIRIRVIKGTGDNKVLIKRSVSLTGKPIKICTLSSFRRRVGVLNAG